MNMMDMQQKACCILPCGHPAAACMTVHICAAPDGHSRGRKTSQADPISKKKRESEISWETEE